MSEFINENKICLMFCAIEIIIYMIAFFLKGKEKNLLGFMRALLNCISISLALLVELILIMNIFQIDSLRGAESIILVFPIIFLGPVINGIIKSINADLEISLKIREYFSKIQKVMFLFMLIAFLFLIEFLIFNIFLEGGFSLMLFIVALTFFIGFLYFIVKLIENIWNININISEKFVGYVLLNLFMILAIAFIFRI